MKSITRIVFTATVLTASSLASQVAAHNHMGSSAGNMDHSKMMSGMKSDEATATKPGASAMAEAEVRRVDKANGKVTLRHGEIKPLDMPPMTMVFDVSDKGLLEQIKAGDQVMVRITHENGKMTVTEIKPRQ